MEETQVKEQFIQASTANGRCPDFDDDCVKVPNHHKCWMGGHFKDPDGNIFECDRAKGWCPFIHGVN